jgi:hypothetical protein
MLTYIYGGVSKISKLGNSQTYLSQIFLTSTWVILDAIPIAWDATVQVMQAVSYVLNQIKDYYIKDNA